MTIVLLKDELNTTLSLFSKVKGAVTNPYLNSTLFQVDGNEVKITVFNFEYGATIKLLTSNLNTEKGSFCVDTSMLSNIIARCSDEITFNIEDTKLQIKSKTASYSLAVMNADDYPEIPVVKEGQFVSFKTEDFLSGLKHTAYCIGDPENNQKFSGLNILTEDGKLYFRAVDGYRAVEYGINVAYKDDPFYATVKKDVVRFLLEVAKFSDVENVAIGRGSRHINFDIGDYTIFSRLLEADKMDLTPFKNKSYGNECTVKTADILTSLQQVEPTIENVSKNPTRCEGDEGKMSFTSISSIGKSKTECECEWKGSPLKIGFNNKFMVETLKNLACETVVLKFGNAVSPIEVYNAENSLSWALVLPMRLKN